MKEKSDHELFQKITENEPKPASKKRNWRGIFFAVVGLFALILFLFVKGYQLSERQERAAERAQVLRSMGI